MSKNTSILLDDHFEDFIERKVSSGRYNSASDVIRNALRLLEEEEAKVEYLKAALEEGEKGGNRDDFNSEEHLEELHGKFL